MVDFLWTDAFRIKSSWPESLSDLLSLDLLDLLDLLAMDGGGTTVELGRLHQTR